MSNLPFKGAMATAQRNSSLFMFGGENATSHYTNSFYQLTQTSSTYDWAEVPQTNPPEPVAYAKAAMANDVMYVFGGISNNTISQILPLQYNQYSFNTQSWTAGSTNNQTNTTGLPINRYFSSATFDGQNTIYIYAGALNSSIVFSDFFKFDITTNTFTELPNPGIPRYGHTASYTSTGKLVILGGVMLVNQSGTIGSTLAPVRQVMVYDTTTSSWNIENVTTNNSTYPSTRSNHNAAVTSDDKIIVFGGDNQDTERKRMYLNAVCILDTNTWSWTLPTTSGIPPSRRTLASGGILDGEHLTIAFGVALNSYFNDVNVMSISTGSWLQTFSTTSTSSSSLSGGAIAGIVVACVIVGIILLFLLWRFQAYLRWLLMRIHKDIWKPRTGEPLWAETTRIVFQIFLLFIFTVFLVFVIRQAIESPNVTQSIEEAAAAVDIPDIRFCFDGYPSYPDTDSRATGVSCSTDMGYSCTQDIQALDMNIFSPVFADSLGAVTCYLFKPSDGFKLTGTSGNNNGSRILFTLYGDQAIDYGRIHVSVYPQRMDPNAIIYGISDNNVLLTEPQVLEWQTNERNDIQVDNVYDIQPFTYSALSYKLIDHRYLQSDGWNYVGFLPITNSTPEVETTFRQEAPNPNYKNGHADLGVFAVYPSKFVTTTEKEVKIYTLVNALGFVGGIFGLLITIQAWLFGFRPRSPWGVVHRWSVGDMKRSLLNGLQSKFRITNSGIPLVHPVHHRFSMTDLTQMEENELQRINRVEERMQMLEMLFKAYYVDDEVFRSLDDANRTKQMNNPRIPLHQAPSSFSEGPKTEKVVDDGFMGSKPTPFNRQDTDMSSASHIPLTQRNYQHAPPYQPGTTVQIHDDEL
ncbi:hypothetical protein CU098_012763 [Rhizopus stolonifer]|uniref:Galactose oxidase n=1 Tax=Rhizopus stolonifer TaxID=4846 RepID=A0A367KWK4_RHIST|nr:hypothetical protein CU098_012763 [Rhizopus stolonifer]